MALKLGKGSESFVKEIMFARKFKKLDPRRLHVLILFLVSLPSTGAAKNCILLNGNQKCSFSLT